MIQVGSYVETKNGKTGVIRSVHYRESDIIYVILLKGYSCYCCTSDMILE